MTDTFETDFTRNNPDRKPFGKSNGADALSLNSDYVVKDGEVQPPEPPKPETPPEMPAPKFTHKLDNGETLEAPSIDELAKKIEQHFKTPPAPPVTDWDDKPVYESMILQPRELTVQEQADILNIWRDNPQKAMRMLEEANLGAKLEDVTSRLNRTELLYRDQLEKEAAADFLGEAENYNVTPANGKKLTAYLKEKGKPLTKNNLLKAFNDLAATDKTMLRPPDAPIPPTPPVDDTITDVPPPPSHMPANMGAREEPQQPGIDVKAFADLPIGKQKEYFANLKRKPN